MVSEASSNFISSWKGRKWGKWVENSSYSARRDASIDKNIIESVVRIKGSDGGTKETKTKNRSTQQCTKST